VGRRRKRKRRIKKRREGKERGVGESVEVRSKNVL
jgi:hypothetical protein